MSTIEPIRVHGPHCPCESCRAWLDTCRRLYERNPETDLRDPKEQLRPFMLAVRQENTFHAWGKNTPGKAATADDQSPWTENNVRGLEDFDDGEHQ